MNAPLITRLGAVRIFVADFERALGFYRDTLGLNLRGSDPGSWALFHLANQVTLLVERIDPAEAESAELVGRFAAISLATSGIAGTYERLEAAGVSFDRPPEKQFWGGWLTHFRDPDGNTLTLMQDSGEEARR